MQHQTCLGRWSAGPSPTRIRILSRSTKDGSGIARALVGFAQIVVESIVINPVPFLKLTGPISPQADQFLFSILHQWTRSLAQKVILQNGSQNRGLSVRFLKAALPFLHRIPSAAIESVRSSYLVGEENTVILVLVGRVDPRVAHEVHPAAARDILEGQAPEIELAVVLVPYHKCPGKPDLLVPIECNFVCGFPGHQRCDFSEPFFKVCRLPQLPLQPIFLKNLKKMKEN